MTNHLIKAAAELDFTDADAAMAVANLSSAIAKLDALDESLGDYLQQYGCFAAGTYISYDQVGFEGKDIPTKAQSQDILRVQEYLRAEIKRLNNAVRQVNKIVVMLTPPEETP